MHICLIGPSYPFRGGLAHYTTLLYRHLCGRHQVAFYTFKRQYPRWLFPGRTDKDTSAAPLREGTAQYVLDSLNPLTWLSVCRRIKQDRPELVIIPWWTSFWTPQLWTIATIVKRSSSAKILFICHNIVDHEALFFSRICSRAVLRKGNHFLVHSQNDGERLRGLVRSAPITHAFHPLYSFFNDGLHSSSAAKAKLGVQGEVILFFGFIRPYKGLQHLLQAMSLVLTHRQVILLVVGEFWAGKEAYAQQIQALKIGHAVKVVDQYVPNEEVGLYFSAADLVVLPYVSGTGSGIVQIAYGLDKPVVATRVGSLPEVVDDSRTGYLVNPGDPCALADAILRFFVEGKAVEFIENIKRRKGQFSWERMVEVIEQVASDSRPRTNFGESSCAPL
jgi:glycosyltransferase involved in cell wall biosynthesis